MPALPVLSLQRTVDPDELVIASQAPHLLVPGVAKQSPQDSVAGASSPGSIRDCGRTGSEAISRGDQRALRLLETFAKPRPASGGAHSKSNVETHFCLIGAGIHPAPKHKRRFGPDSP